MTDVMRAAALSNFVGWAEEHIDGDEKGEAQIFLDRLFRGFGWGGLREAGATCELRVKKDEGGTAFADLVWKPHVVIEMKRRGVDLSKHYRQAFGYWTRLVPNRPRYAVLCNFDEFWVYDFETQMDTPVDVVSLSDLPKRYGPLAFLFTNPEVPIFGNHQESVTRQAADKLATCFNSLVDRGTKQPLAQRFILQTLMALFAEDIGLLDKYFFTRLLDECKTPSDTYDKLGGLFETMNTRGGTKGGRFKGVAYFNGGLFAKPAHVELNSDELRLLHDASQFNWSKVRPEIFGTLFEHSLGLRERHAFGAHFTSPVDIMKIVGPTIVEPWEAAIESATTLKGLQSLLKRIENFTVLDPACGSGNFLYISYRELKRLEARIYERMGEYSSINANQRAFGFVSTGNFFGIDINPFAINIAKVTMMLGHKLAIDELAIHEEALPLDNLDANFLVCDALLSGTEQTPWPVADVIIGNPPFLGAKLLKPEFGVRYVESLRRAYPTVPGMADYCVYWFRRAHDALEECTVKDPFKGRAGLVGTQNIRNNASRIGGLDYIVETGTIVEAVDNQPWSGEANVHVAIANWVKSQDSKLLPKQRRLWFNVAATSTGAKRARGTGSAAKLYELDVRLAPHINSALSDKADLSTAAKLKCNEHIVVCQGVTPGHAGFVLSAAERKAIIGRDKKSGEVIHPYLVGDDFLSGHGARRFIIDFQQTDILTAQAFSGAFNHVKNNVLPDIAKKKKDSERGGAIDTWWHHWRARTELKEALLSLPRYLVCSRVTKRPIFIFVHKKIFPGDALQVFALADDYSFGILQSRPHYEWFHSKCSNMKSDPRYTSESVFATFPWPQRPKDENVSEVAEAGRELRALQAASLTNGPSNLRALYRTLEMPGKNPLRDAHERLDRAVLRVYGFPAKCDLLQRLLDLNIEVGNAEMHLHTIDGPGVPVGYKHAKKLISTDCLS